MTGSRQPLDRSQPRPLVGLISQLSLLMTGGLLVGGTFVGFGLWRAGDRFIQDLRSLLNPPQPAPQVDIRSIVVDRVQQVSELTTAVFAMEAVVPTSRDRTFGGYVVGTTKLIYIAYGEVRAGIDLSQLRPDDVQVTGDVVTLRLPAPQILDSKIDVTRSRVFDYDRGFLGLGPDIAPQLQSIAQQETLQKITQTACDQGILNTANQKADLAITQLLETAESSQQFIVETQPPAACAVTAPAASTPAEAPIATPLPSTP
ncbi:DUF4230 domain-containing protein [Microcoleus sp. FACHB-1515]|uniref:DUF4230 domain-containing protein n=1 Tax=Cyanophyceae TaxID=3028117 RepID=UPI001684FACD|nr:DUF4230 domain-containing protein [Microcoleus sp. FACHB-1515]MBD2092170.1 DUF4230 domain-containing protein [Microcoleus sp. FACHB-1515]